MTDDMQDSAPATDALATFPKPVEPVALPEAVALCAQCVDVTLPGMCTCGANRNLESAESAAQLDLTKTWRRLQGDMAARFAAEVENALQPVDTNLNALPQVEPLPDEPAHDDDFGGMSAV